MRARTWWAALGVVAAVAFLVVLHNHRRSPPASASASPPARPQPALARPEPGASASAQSPQAAAPVPLAATDVIGNPECRFFPGARDARELAAVVVPDEADEGGQRARFAVIDAGGRVFDGVLPFVPRRASLGKRPDGAVVGFQGERAEDRLPVRILRDGNLVYEHDFVWDFNVAANGLSYFAVEGSPYNEYASLVLRNWDLDIETQLDISDRVRLRTDWLGNEVRRRAGWHRAGLGIAYTPDNTEIILSPRRYPRMSVPGEYTFLPVDGGEPRTIAVPEKGAAFASSRVGYYYVDGEASRRVVKRRFDWGSPDGFTTVEVWAKELDTGALLVDLMLSDDGERLAVIALPFAILDAKTGQVAFAFPTAAELGRAVRKVSGNVAVADRHLLRALAVEPNDAPPSGNVVEGMDVHAAGRETLQRAASRRVG